MIQGPQVPPHTDMEIVGGEAPICDNGVCQVPAENPEGEIPLD